MRLLDITGPLYNGLWTCGEPFPDYHIRPLKQPEWVTAPVWLEVFEGMHSQTGTYLETPAHFLGYEKSYRLTDVPLEALYEREAVVLQVRPEDNGERPPVTADMLEEAAAGLTIPAGAALLVSTGWGTHWRLDDYLTRAPYFTRDAMDWLIARRPFLLSSDMPRWENLEHPQGFFPAFYAADILMLAPTVHLERIDRPYVKLTVLPLYAEDTCCCPCRAVVIL